MIFHEVILHSFLVIVKLWEIMTVVFGLLDNSLFEIRTDWVEWKWLSELSDTRSTYCEHHFNLKRDQVK